MDLNLWNRVMFIGGASRGIGLGIARACVAVVLTARGGVAATDGECAPASRGWARSEPSPATCAKPA